MSNSPQSSATASGAKITEPKFNVSFFKSELDTEPVLRSIAWETFCERLAKFEVRGSKKGAPLFSGATFDGPRLKANVRDVSVLALDIDDGMTIEEATALLAGRGNRFAIYSTFGHRPDHHKFRVVIPLHQPIPSAEYLALWKSVNRLFGEVLDAATKDASRMSYLPIVPQEHKEDFRFVSNAGALLDWQELLSEFPDPAVQNGDESPKDVGSTGPKRYAEKALSDECWEVAHAQEGTRNTKLNKAAFSLGQLVGAGKLLDRGMVESELLHAAWRCGLPEGEAIATIQSAMDAGERSPRKNLPVSPEGESHGFQPVRIREKPCLHSDSLYGLAGDVVRAIEPHTEADPAALLFQFLACFGNYIGRTAHGKVGSAEHYGNLFGCLVGQSATARKGTSLYEVKRLFFVLDSQSDPAGGWESRCVSGLSSGEGLTYHVRDERWGEEVIREKGKRAGTQSVLMDEGVSDKRLLAIESEFAAVLRAMERDGNKLSAILRQAWDGSSLRSLTKSDPNVATNPHISVIGHVTGDELVRYLNSTEVANGLANRFLWVSVTRSKLLPDGGAIHTVDFTPILSRLNDAVFHAKQVGTLVRDPEASELWGREYGRLTGGKPGLLGAVTSRGDAQTLRLSVLYAVLDCSPVIRIEHLRAALALWNYCDESARFIFGDALGDPVADELLRVIRDNAEFGMTRTDLQNHFKRNQSAARIGKALALLAESGLIRRESEKTEGRSAERWFPQTAYEINELNEKRSATGPEQAEPADLNSSNSFNSYQESEQNGEDAEVVENVATF